MSGAKKIIIASKIKSVCAESLEIDPNFSIEKFISSHSPIEDELKEVSQIIKQYSGNEATPLPYKIFLNQVELFELELRKHAIIEDPEGNLISIAEMKLKDEYTQISYYHGFAPE